MRLKFDTVYTYRRWIFDDGHKLSKVHLFRTGGQWEQPLATVVRPPATTHCGFRIFSHSIDMMGQIFEERDFETRPFNEPDDCKVCCKGLESGMLGMYITTGGTVEDLQVHGVVRKL